MSLTEDNDPAREANLKFPLVRDAVLEQILPGFATTRVKLVKSATAPAFGFANAFLLPTDMIYPLSIRERARGEVSYDDTSVGMEEGNTYVTDLSDIFLRYVKREENVTLYSSLFTSALASKLAMEYSFAITGSSTVFGNLAALADDFMRKARAKEARRKGARLPSVSFSDIRRQSRGTRF